MICVRVCVCACVGETERERVPKVSRAAPSLMTMPGNSTMTIFILGNSSPISGMGIPGLSSPILILVPPNRFRKKKA